MHKHRAPKQSGFTLIELLVVIAIVGILVIISAPFFRGMTTDAAANQIASFAQGAANNFRLINTKCNTSNDTAASTIVTTPSVANSLALVVTGSSFVNSTYSGCYADSGVVPLHSKATGNSTDGFKVGGYAVAWSGGSGSTPIAFVFTGVLTEVALVLYRQYSSASGAQTATAMPAVADTTDPMFRFTAPSGGLTTITLRIQ